MHSSWCLCNIVRLRTTRNNFSFAVHLPNMPQEKKCLKKLIPLLNAHEAYTVTFVEQPSCHFLNICENKWYHLIDAHINIQNMIVPHVK